MRILGVTPQLRTTDLAESIRFYTTTIGLTLEFRYQDFYAGIRAGDQVFHLKQVCEKDRRSRSWRKTTTSISICRPTTRRALHSA